MRRILPSVALIFSTVLAQAQEISLGVGTNVVTKSKVPTKPDDRLIGDQKEGFFVYKVEGVKGDWLWLVSRFHQGWVPKGDVVPIDQGIDYCTQEIKAKPDSAWAYGTRGVLWRMRGDHDKAIADFDQSIRLDPKLANAFINRGDAWGMKNDYDKAITDYDEALRLDPKYALVLMMRGYAWFYRRIFDKAVADFSEAVRLDPMFAEAYNNRAWIWATCPDETHRDGKRAVESATRACELNGWKDSNDFDTLAAAYAEAGDFDQAVTMQRRGMELLKDDNRKKLLRTRLQLYEQKTAYREKK